MGTCCTPTSARRPRRRPRSCSPAFGRRRQARILTTFNEPDLGLAVALLLTYFTDPTARPAEEPRRERLRPAGAHLPLHVTGKRHHMFVGETGLSRVDERSLEGDEELGSDDPAASVPRAAVDCRCCRNISTSGARPPSTCSARRSRRNSAANFPTGSKGPRRAPV